MGKKILEFDTYFEAADAVISRLESRKIDLGFKHIVICPNTHTLFFESRLCEKEGGYFDIEMYSLSRLYYKLGGGPLISREGAVMIIKQILRETELSCFNRSKGFKGFALKLYDTLNRFIDSGIMPKDLNGQGATGLKLNDIKNVYEKFLERTQNLYIDKGGTLRLLKEKLETSDFFKNSYTYAALFDGVSKREQEILDLIALKSLSFTQTVVSGGGAIKAQTEIYAAESRAVAIKAAAKRVKDAAENGVKYNEMCLVCSPDSYETAKRIFNEYSVPLYTDKKEKLSRRALAQYLLTLIRLKRPDRADFIMLSKNPFSGIDCIKSGIFENYCEKFNVEYAAFFKTFELTDAKSDEKKQKEILETANQTRAKLNYMVNSFWGGLKKCVSAGDFCAFIKSFINAAVDLSDEKEEAVKNKLIEILSLISLTDEKNEDTAFLLDMFCEGIEAAELGSLPLLADCVIMGGAQVFRGKKHKYAFILDFNEGVLPECVLDLGVLSQRDCIGLTQNKIELSPSLDVLNNQSQKELTQVMAGAQRLFISYIKSGESRPSPLLYKIHAETKAEINSFEKETELLDLANLRQLTFYAGGKSGGLEHLLLTANKPTVFTSSLYEVLQDTADRFLKADAPQNISRDVFNMRFTSATQLQTYFDCPYKHFAKFGLRARPGEKGKMTLLDIGSLMHAAAEMFFKSGFDEAKLGEIIENVLKDYAYKLDKKSGYKQKLFNEIKKLCLVFSGHIKGGKFKPLGAEVKLNPLNVIKPVFLEDTELTGSIDYVDCYNGYIRVIDYKSGAASYENKLVYYGVKLQLPLYMQACIESGFQPAAMLYFPFFERWEENDYRFNGVFNQALDVVLAMDNSLLNAAAYGFSGEKVKAESGIIEASVKETKAGLKAGGPGAKDSEEFKAVCLYAKQVSESALKQIKNGNIAPSPYKDGKKHSCAYCDYPVACDFKGSFRILNESIKSFKE